MHPTWMALASLAVLMTLPLATAGPGPATFLYVGSDTLNQPGCQGSRLPNPTTETYVIGNCNVDVPSARAAIEVHGHGFDPVYEWTLYRSVPLDPGYPTPFNFVLEPCSSGWAVGRVAVQDASDCTTLSVEVHTGPGGTITIEA